MKLMLSGVVLMMRKTRTGWSIAVRVYFRS
ncbi:hypothetical protein REJC140_02474 [Pseudorhizobium endolithicum]|uniref:Transposase n=1 Tax=Pseudorhizobium endolithicum TaxID=1191678 RepID=A0ABM8PFM1_9HYPH|nr:hypothetical protein REQ54_02170 [Rhizobium sp. Q54]CAD7027214.1 hypothetical protein REJC140_02474 [Pseudorhizobium endolithicum]